MPADLPARGERPLAERRVVAVGGGHGLAAALHALRVLGAQPTAVVTVADDGGSSGRLRRDLGIVAVGDLRMALCALARRGDLADLLGHRFARGQLGGHALGNLALVAAVEQAEGDLVAAVDRLAGVLDAGGRVLPATTDPVQLKARVAGQTVDGQARVTETGPVDRVWLEPDAPHACPQAVAAIDAADLIVIGPGSLFTSLVATLLVPGIGQAVRRAPAALVHVLNTNVQAGETTGLDAGGHLTALTEHLPGLTLDALVVHRGPLRPDLEPLDGAVPDAAARVTVAADVLARQPDGQPGHGHDPSRLADALAAAWDRLHGAAAG